MNLTGDLTAGPAFFVGFFLFVAAIPTALLFTVVRDKLRSRRRR